MYGRIWSKADGFVEHTKRVSPTCLIRFDRNRYSVPASFANLSVSLRIYSDRIVVVAEGQRVCEHARVIDRTHRSPGRTIYDWRHYLAVVQRKPGAMRSGAPFTELPDAFRQLRQQLLRRTGGDREMVDLRVSVRGISLSIWLGSSAAPPAKSPSGGLNGTRNDGRRKPKAHITSMLSGSRRPSGRLR